MGKGLLIGRKVETKSGFGFKKSGVEEPTHIMGESVCYKGEGHLMTVAPTGAGKGVSCVVPALIHHEGSAVVLDMKGENYVMSARHRREMGQDVVCLDPFDMVSGFVDVPESERAGFNPFDLLPYLSDDRSSACRQLADMILEKDGPRADRFWRDTAVSILAGLISVYDRYPNVSRSLWAMMEDLRWTPRHRMNYFGDVSFKERWEARLCHDIELRMDMEELHMDMGTVSALLKSVVEHHEMKKRQKEVEFEPRMRDIMAAMGSSDLGGLTQQEAIQNLLNEMESARDMREDLEDELREWELVDAVSGVTFERLLRYAQDYIEHCDLVVHPEEKIFPQGGLELAEYPMAIHGLAMSRDPLARQALSICASAPDRTWGSILAVLNSGLSQFSGLGLNRFLSGSFDFNKVLDGEDVTVYVAFPPNKIKSHSTVFSLLVEGIMNIALQRCHPPEKRTLFILDEVAQLGHMPFLVTAKTLMRGYGVQVWSLWQDFSQLQSNYPEDWPTLLNNARVIQVFGRNMNSPSSHICESLDLPREALMGLKDDEILVWNDSPHCERMIRPVCYEDDDLKPFCDAGPLSPATRGRRGAAARGTRPRRTESGFSHKKEVSALGENTVDRSKFNSGEL